MLGYTAHTEGYTLILTRKDLLSRLSLVTFENLEGFVTCLQDYGFLVLHKTFSFFFSSPPPPLPHLTFIAHQLVGWVFFVLCFSVCPVLDFFS